jgi:hypothetical protein
VVVLCTMPVPVLVAFTLAPATTAPDGSVKVPLMAPRNVWAFPATANRASATKIPITCLISLLQQNPNNLGTGGYRCIRVTLQLGSQIANVIYGYYFQSLTEVPEGINMPFGKKDYEIP